MKKSVIIIIALIFVISIALVNFLGVKHKVFDEVINVDSISFDDESIKIHPETGEKYIRLSPDENGERKYQIRYLIGPEDASNKGVRFTIASNCATVDENGLVTFTEAGDAIITILPADDSDCRDTLLINFKS